MKRKFAIFLLILLLLQMRISVLAAETSGDSGKASIVSAYCMGDTFYSFMETDGCDVENMIAQTELVGGSQAQPVSFQESGAAVTYVLLIDNSGSMKKYASSVAAYADALIEGETQSATFIIITFGEQVLFNELVDTQACLDREAVKNTVLNAIGQIDYKEQWTDPYTGIVSVMDYLDRNYPGDRGDLVNLILMTDGTPDLKYSSAEEGNARAAAERIAETPEVVLHTVSFQAWDSSHTIPEGTGTDTVVDAEVDAAGAADVLTDFVHGLYRVDFEHFMAADQVPGRYDCAYYLRNSGDGITEAIQLIPLAVEKVPVMTEGNNGWSGPYTKPEESPAEGRESQSPETQSPETGEPQSESEAESKSESQPESEIESETESELQQTGDGVFRSDMFRNGIYAGGAVLILIVVIVLICTVARILKKQRRHGAGGGTAIFMRLEVLSGHCAGKKTEYYLRDELLIGRASDCDLVWREAGVSPRNSRIFLKDQVVYIEDLDSREGTLLEGMRIYSPNRLRSGDVITIGEVSFRFFF